MKAQVRYAGFWLRLWAGVVDLIVIALIIGFLGGVASRMGILLPPDASLHLEVIMGAWFISFSFVFQILYFSFLLSSSWQATIGMRIFGLKVTGYDYQRISFGLAFIRELSTILSAIILYIGFLMIAFTKKKQALHDLIANTYVIKANTI